jgi:tetratricopeptide (TPR) repeat protein
MPHVASICLGWALALVAPSLLVGCTDRGEEHVRKGNVFFSNHDLPAAEGEYRAALDKQKDYPPALIGLGDVAYERSEPAEAERWYRLAAADPRAVAARHRLAIALSSLGRDREAIAELEAAIAIDPKDVFALYSLGNLHQKLGDTKKAEQMQHAALAIDKDHRGARFALANLELDAGRFDEAERELTALSVAGAKPLSEYGLARLAALKGRPEEAAAHLEQVLALGVTNPSKIVVDPAFARSWSHPSMQAVRARLEANARSAAGTGTATTAR